MAESSGVVLKPRSEVEERRSRHHRGPGRVMTSDIRSDLRWAKSRDSYRRIASESYRCDSNR